MASSRSWSDLLIDILHVICGKLLIKDLVVFGDVCTHWRTSLWLYLKYKPSRLPVLMHAISPDSNSFREMSRFFSSVDFRKHVYHGTKDCRYLGSSHGWLFRSYSHYDKQPKLQLLNTYSPVVNVINLPFLNMGRVKKVILSNNPARTTSYTVMAISCDSKSIFDGEPELLFCKPGDASWTRVDYREPYLRNIAYCNNLLYAGSCLGHVVSCDISSTDNPKVTRVVTSPSINLQGLNTTHLVESSGNLLYVARAYVHDQHVDRVYVHDQRDQTTGFRVFYLHEKDGKWIESNNLQGHALFLDNCSSFSLLASDYPNCKPNHIYFAYQGEYEESEIGVFNLEDFSFPLHISGGRNLYWYLPIWVQPTFNMKMGTITSQMQMPQTDRKAKRFMRNIWQYASKLAKFKRCNAHG